MKLKNDVEKGYSSDPYYDFFIGGYFEPERFLDLQEDIDKVNEARKTISEYMGIVVEEE